MMRHGSVAPPETGEVKRVTKTDTLLAHIKGLGRDRYDNPIGIRTGALSDATGVPKNSIQMLLDPHVKTGALVVCKITGPNGREEREYRAGPGVPPPDFKPLNTKRNGIARGGVTKPLPVTTPAPLLSTPKPTVDAIRTPTLITKTQPEVVAPHVAETPAAGGAAPPPAETAVAAQATPKPNAGAVLKKKPATRRASAGNDLLLSIDQDGALQIGYGDDPARWIFQPAQVLALGDFLHGTQGVWRP